MLFRSSLFPSTLSPFISPFKCQEMSLSGAIMGATGCLPCRGRLCRGRALQPRWLPQRLPLSWGTGLCLHRLFCFSLVHQPGWPASWWGPTVLCSHVGDQSVCLDRGHSGELFWAPGAHRCQYPHNFPSLAPGEPDRRWGLRPDDDKLVCPWMGGTLERPLPGGAGAPPPPTTASPSRQHLSAAPQPR